MKNPFDKYIIGTVNPDEYDWIKQFLHAAKEGHKNGEVFRVFDLGKVIGLASAYWELTERCKNENVS